MSVSIKRLFAVLLTVCMVMQMIVSTPAASAEDSGEVVAEYVPTTVENEGYVTLDGVNIEHNTTLTDNGDGTYTLDAIFVSKPTRQEISDIVPGANGRVVLTAHKGIYEVVKSGWYLLDLWGGSGASVTNAGNGGKGGHVYAKVYLTEGQTLYYTLGSNGEPTKKTHTGGGVNGPGGGHGYVGGYTVGGGGGYSAVFLYNEGKFEELYSDFDFSKDTISESDRVTKFIMIAGGGGGGGASPDSGSVANNAAHGGDGGSVGGTSGVVSGDNVIGGTYFSGTNGHSSGSSRAYTGRGGSNVAGQVADSWWGITDAKALPPDNWFGTESGRGGAGGSGELRGGGGGAGYAGGSGGLMTSVLIASNVGGGGGGSSFIVSDVNGRSTDYSNIADAEEYLTASNPSDTGGALGITFLENDDYSPLGDLTFENCLSPYIIPVVGGLTVTNSDESEATFSWEPHHGEENHEKISLGNISLLDKDGNLGGSARVVLTFTYSAGFMGGNNVPVFRHAEEVSYSCPVVVKANINGETQTRLMELGDDVGAVNMPLLIEAHAHDLEANTAGTVFYMNQMFYDHYADVRDNLDSYQYEYDFIENIGEYIVETAGGQQIFDGAHEDASVVSVAPNSRSDYTVKIPVTIKQTGVAKVGEPIVCDENGKVNISDISTIMIPGSRHEQLGKFMVTYTKGIDYSEEDDLYTYSLNVHSVTSKEHNITPDSDGVNHVMDFDSSSVVEYEHTIEVTGWYLIQIWGGNGGDGGNSIIGLGAGGASGKGGYVQGYVHLDRGDIVNIFMGVNGTDGSSKWLTAGGGGKHSRASVIKDGKETVLMIAGGGGGGGYYLLGAGTAGGSVTQTDTNGNPNSSSEYSAYDGKSGNGKTGGAGGKNYINTSLVKTSVQPSDNFDDAALNKFNNASTGDYGGPATHGGGTVYVRCLQITDDGASEVVKDIKEALLGFGFNANVSKYFKIESVNVTNLDSERDPYNASYNYVLGSDTALSITNINPKVEVVTAEGDDLHTASIDFNIVVTLSPSEGFAGGNDVPLFTDKVELTHDQIRTDGGTHTEVTEKIELGDNDTTDFVNVSLNYTQSSLVGSKIFYSVGEPAIPRDSLYTIISGETPVMPIDEDWEYDYVDIINSITELGDDSEVPDLLSPSKTTEYSVKIGLAPKNLGSKASVSDIVKAEVAETTAIIIVGHEVNFDLDNMTHDMPDFHGKYVAEHDKDLVFTLTPDEDWSYPDTISVSVLGKGTLEAGVDYTYVKGSGKVTVKSEAITNDVTVRASAKAPTYTLTFMYALSPESGEYGKVTQDFAEGADIGNAFHTTYFPEFDGYTFHWDWGNSETVAPDVMPGQDMWIIGRFVPNTYNVSVKFESDDAIALPDTITAECKYGEQYFISIPMIDGYLAYVDGDVFETVQGTMGAGDVEVTVKYRSSNGIFSVIYTNAATGEQLKSVSQTVALGESCEHAIVMPEGYTEGYTQGKTENAPDASWTSINETMVEGGVLVTVYCIPNVYSVNFVVDENVIETRKVTFGDIYGYNSDGEYIEFTIPQKQGYRFKGWYVGEVRTYGDTVVATPADHDIVAIFEVIVPDPEDSIFVLTISYVKEDGDQAHDSYSADVMAGSAYSVESPVISGFTPDKNIVQGTMPAHDLFVVVTYFPDYSGEPVVSVTVEWGSMNFNFERGMWDPFTHTYSDDTFTPETVGANSIVITNTNSYVYDGGVEKKIKVNAALSYTKNSGLGEMVDGLNGFLTEGDVNAERITRTEIANGNSATVYLWLEGDFNPDSLGTFDIGTCSVTISQGGYETEGGE